MINFPKDFIWGAATASYQIEGAVNEDGRGPSIWDTFTRIPGAIDDGSSGDVACDHYHRYKDDIALMARLGLKNYRFSIAWPRVIPQGTGAVNPAGLDFYERLVDTLLANGIEPYATLYHWDLPQAMQDAGGWPMRSIVDAYVNYADVVSRRLGDRVHHWMTHNEPRVVSFVGYREGRHAPGIKNLSMALNASHHLLLSHGKAVPVLRANGDSKTKVGIVLDMIWVDPASDSAEDVGAARRYDGYFNRWFFDPVLKGSYPADMLEVYAKDGPTAIQDGDMQTIAAPIDFIGINYYTRAVMANDPNEPFLQMVRKMPPGDYTEMNNQVYPTGLYNLLSRLRDEYKAKSIYITENGVAFKDEVSADGHVHDARRTAYLKAHFTVAHKAISEGVPLHAYFVWSLMDNFEWAFGYTKRFGVTYVDYQTQQRIVKDSGLWYSEVIKRNGVEE